MIVGVLLNVSRIWLPAFASMVVVAFGFASLIAGLLMRVFGFYALTEAELDEVAELMREEDEDMRPPDDRLRPV